MANTRKTNPLIAKFEQILRKTGFDDNYIHASNFHFGVIQQKHGDTIRTRDEFCSVLMSKLFIDKSELYPTERFTCKANENSDWPIPPLPAEVFGAEISKKFKVNLFHKCLKIGDVLDCRVASILPSEYTLRVIHKYGVTDVLDNLDIMVTLPFSIKSNLEILKKELLLCELVRVAVSKFANDGDKIITYVTVDEKTLETEEAVVPLGRIPEEILPSYILSLESHGKVKEKFRNWISNNCDPGQKKYPFYADYIQSHPQFQNLPLLNRIFEEMGLDPYKLYSFYPNYYGQTLTDETAAQILLKKSKAKMAQEYANQAFQKSKQKNIEEALNYIDVAVEVCPFDEALKKSLYIWRADYYSRLYNQTKSPIWLKKAIFELTIVYYQDPENKLVYGPLSKLLFKLTNLYYRLKNYKEAALYAELALHVNKQNCEAETLLEYLKKKRPEACINFDQESLVVLQETKNKLVSELKRCSRT